MARPIVAILMAWTLVGGDALLSAQDSLQATRLRIQRMRTRRDPAGLQRLALEIKADWLATKSPGSALAALDVVRALDATRYGSMEAYEVICDLAITVVDSPEDKPPEATAWLLLMLQGDMDYNRGMLKGVAWAKERRVRAERWLRTWKSMRDQLAVLPKGGTPLYGNIAPPPGSGLPSGVAPSAIKDPVLRKQYEEALAANARNIEIAQKRSALTSMERLLASVAKRYVVDVYCRMPFAPEEMEDLLEVYGLDDETRTTMADEARRRVAAQLATFDAATLASLELGLMNDSRLLVPLKITLKQPKAEDLLEQLRQATGVTLTRAKEIPNEGPIAGSYSFYNTPAWKVMEMMAQSKFVQGTWQKEDQGYRLVWNGQPVAQLPRPVVPPVPFAPMPSTTALITKRDPSTPQPVRFVTTTQPPSAVEPVVQPSPPSFRFWFLAGVSAVAVPLMLAAVWWRSRQG